MRNDIKETVKYVIKAIIILIIGFAIGYGLFCITDGYMMECEKNTLYLQEIEDGVYAYVEYIVSNVPMDNYSIVTFCNDDGKVITIKGDEYISYISSDDSAYVVWMKYPHMVYSDNVILYVPAGTVKYLGSSGTGR